MPIVRPFARPTHQYVLGEESVRVFTCFGSVPMVPLEDVIKMGAETLANLPGDIEALLAMETEELARQTEAAERQRDVDRTRDNEERKRKKTVKPARSGNIYIIQAEDGACKIGLTKSKPQSRLDACQTGNHQELNLLWFGRVADMEATEGSLHEMFAAKNLRREWFRLTDEEIERVKTFCEERKEVA